MAADLPIQTIQRAIYVIRGQKVMLDSELAGLYGVPTHRLNEAVKRNLSRFPEDFMIQVTEDEWKNLISQFAISSLGGHGGRRFVYGSFPGLRKADGHGGALTLPALHGNGAAVQLGD